MGLNTLEGLLFDFYLRNSTIINLIGFAVMVLAGLWYLAAYRERYVGRPHIEFKHTQSNRLMGGMFNLVVAMILYVAIGGRDPLIIPGQGMTLIPLMGLIIGVYLLCGTAYVFGMALFHYIEAADSLLKWDPEFLRKLKQDLEKFLAEADRK